MTLPQDTMRRPLHDLRISLTDRCNLRCTYCMPAEIFGPDYAFLPREHLLSFEEIERLARIFVSLGVTKLRLTGGEPLLRPGVVELVERLAAIPGVDDLALTTNAVLLPRHAEALRAAGLHRVNVSLDALTPEVFREMSGGRGRVDSVLEGIDAGVAAGLDVKINMVVERGVNASEVPPMAEAFKNRGLTLRFIEFMDVGNVNHWEMDKVYPARDILRDIRARWPVEPVEPDYPGEVAKRYRYADGSAEIGIISSVTQPFCRNCSRIRLSADGIAYTCLFASEGHALKPALRGEPPCAQPLDDGELRALIAGIWTRREDRYSEIRGELLARHQERRKVEMSYIGG